MKVSWKLIFDTEQEEAKLYVHEETDNIKRLERYISEDGFYPGYLLCQKEKAQIPVKLDGIYYIETIQEIQYVHTEKEVYKVKQRLYELERMLPYYFMRVSKSAILNLHGVKTYKPFSGGIMLAEFENGDGTYISRKYVKELRNKVREGLL